MTRSRFFFPGFGLLLLSTVGAGFYLYQNLPELLRVQATQYLQKYGVEDIEYDGLHITRSALTLDSLVMRGAYGNYTYEARLTSGEMRYNWRVLLGAKIDSLLLSSLELSVTQTAASASQHSGLIVVDSLMPQQLKAKLPIKSLVINRWKLDYRAPHLQTVAASGSLLLNEHLDAQAQTTLAGGEILIRLRSDFDSDNLGLDVYLRKTQSDIATLSAYLTRATDNGWIWDIKGEAQHSPALWWLREFNAQLGLALKLPATTMLSIQGESAFNAQIHHPNTLNLAATNGSDEAPLKQMKASFQLTNEFRKLDLHGASDSFSGALDIEGTLEHGHFHATLQPFNLGGNLSTQLLSLPESWRHWIGWEDAVPAELNTTEAVTIGSADMREWSFQARNVLLSLGDKKSRFSIQQFNLDTTVTDTGHVEAKTQLSALLNVRLRKQTLPQLGIEITAQGSLEQTTFGLGVTDTAESVHADLAGHLFLPAGRGKYQLIAEIRDLSYFSAMALPLLEQFAILQDTVEIGSGTIHLDTSLQSEAFDVAAWEQRSRLTVANVTGSINEYRFKGLDASAEWSGIERWKTLQPLEFSLSELDIGVAVKDIQWRASLPKTTPVSRPEVHIEAFSATVFGGQLILPEAQAWDFAASSNKVTLQALGWQLSELVALQPNADIEALGTLQGELPLTITDGRILIDNGYLRALPPGGTIRYQANDKSRALSKGSTELALALDLLDDFQYQTLSSEVNLDKAGSLVLGLSLAGSNPGRYEGQPINFNINLEQNIDPLLQSLRLSDNLVDQIEGGLK